jgi:gliding motility-associated-like protein
MKKSSYKGLLNHLRPTITKKVLSVVLLTVLTAISSNTQAQTTIAGWNFFVNSTSTSGIAGNSGVTTFSTSGAFFSGVGCGFQEAIANGGWTSAGKAWSSSSFTTVGYNSMNVTFSHGSFTSSGVGSGPTSFKFQYRVGAGGTWTDIGGAYSIATSTGCGFTTVSKTLPAACNNQSSVFIRTVSQNTGTSGVGNRVANLLITGTAATGCTAPTTPTLSGANNVCPGTSTLLSVSGTLNGASGWRVYSGSTAGTLLGTISTNSGSLSVSPSASTTYVVRGEGCPTAGPTASKTITATDNVNPTAVCQNINVYLDGSGNASIVAGDVDGGSTDNCGAITMAANITAFTCADLGANTVVLTVTDGNSNTANCNATVTVIDTISPTAVCQNITVFLNGAGNASIVAGDVDGGSTDNCGTVSLSASATAFTCANIGANTVTLTVADGNGNTSMCTSTVTVADTISPTASCQNITVFLDGAGSASIVAADIDNGSTDNCTSVSLAASQTAFTCADLGANTVTLTVTDGSGNTSMCTSTVTVSDTISPSAVCQNINVYLNGAGNASIVAGDVDGGSTDNCGTVSLSASATAFTCANIGPNNSILTVTDGSGNTSMCTSTVTVLDTISPTAVSQNITVFLNGIGSATIVAADIDNGSSDNCGSVSLSASQTAFTCANVGANNVILTATDGSGNTNTTSATVTIVSTVPLVTISPSVCGTYTSPSGKVWTTSNMYMDTIPSTYGCDSIITVNLTIRENPVANFTTANVCDGTAASFIDGSSIAAGTFTSAWDFDDTNTSTLTSPSNTYATIGSYDVKLVLTSDLNCKDSITKTVIIHPNPVAYLTTADVCDETAASFTDSSSIATGTFTSAWDFDDTNTSTLTSPSNTYATIGSYDVKQVLTSDLGCKDSITKTVIIHPNPVVDFSATEVCKGEYTYFTNNTSIIGGSFTSEWFFGDGTSYNGPSFNPNHKYSNPLKFNARLEATSDKGCKAQKYDSVFLNPLPQSSFTTMNVCEGATAAFTNTSSISAGSFSAAWNFGDGTTYNHATILYASHVYTNDLTYNVTLTNTSDKGCITTVSKPITIYSNPVANFTVDNVCKGEGVYFNNTTTISSGVHTSNSWSFGDGSSSTSRSPGHLYANALTYDVTLTTGSNQGCTDQMTKQVTIHPNPTANFTATGACFGKAASFTNSTTLSTGTHSVAWDFGDGNTAGSKNASHIYGATGTYSVKLKAVSNQGCVDSIIKPVTIDANPTVSFTTADACLGNAASFYSNSSVQSGTMTHDWNFGDGTTYSTSGRSASKVYADVLTYDVTLKITSNKGCESQLTKQVTVNPLPQVAFTSTNVCEGVATVFNNTSSIVSGSMSPNWRFGDGLSSTLVSPTHTYAKDLSYSVTLQQESDKGCKAELTKNTVVYPNPIADFVPAGACDGVAATFTNQSVVGSGNFTNLWTFHDGATTQAKHPSKIYSGPGTYNVTLDVSTGNGCSDQLIKSVTIDPNPVADFTTTDVCDNVAAAFNNTSTISTGTFASTLWDLGDGTTSTNAAPNRVYSNRGTYNVTLKVGSDKGCTDQITKQVTVFPNPVARFSTGDVCLGTAANYSNVSSIESGTFTNAWTFGDGNSSTAISPTNVYGTIGTFDVKLVLTSDQGCTDEAMGSVMVNPNPVADFTSPDLCFGETSQFTNVSTVGWGTYTSNWNFDDGGTSTKRSPSHLYAAVGTYNVKLDLLSNFGCTGSITKPVEVFANPVASFTVDNVCDGFEIAPNNTSTGGVTINNWKFGDGATSTDVSPTHIYLDGPRFYTISLAVETANGCKDNTTGSVQVYANPVVTVGPDVIIGKGLPTRLSATGGVNYLWTPAFELDDAFIATPTARVSEDTEFTVEIEDNNGCKDTGTVKVTVLENYVVFPRTVITPNGDGINDKFTIDNLNSYPNNSLLIFDRWGREVYQQDSYQQDWEGTKDGSSLPAGTYFYILTFDMNEDAIYKGSITVNKSSN